jgi:hypothetical protein
MLFKVASLIKTIKMDAGPSCKYGIPTAHLVYRKSSRVFMLTRKAH